jgi:hypothetical protein
MASLAVLMIYIFYRATYRWLLPQAQLATGCPCRDPVLRIVEDGNSRHSRDSVLAQIVTKLGELRAVCCVDVDEAVHVANDQLLVTVPWVSLPLRA